MYVYVYVVYMYIVYMYNEQGCGLETGGTLSLCTSVQYTLTCMQKPAKGHCCHCYCHNRKIATVHCRHFPHCADARPSSTMCSVQPRTATQKSGPKKEKKKKGATRTPQKSRHKRIFFCLARIKLTVQYSPYLCRDTGCSVPIPPLKRKRGTDHASSSESVLLQ